MKKYLAIVVLLITASYFPVSRLVLLEESTVTYMASTISIDQILGGIYSGDELYLSNYIHGLYVINCSKPASPVVTGFLGKFMDLLSLHGNYLFILNKYFCSMTDKFYEIEAIDVSNKKDPEEISYWSNDGKLLSVYVDDRYMYLLVDRKGFSIVDHSDEKNLKLSGNLEIPGDLGSIMIISGDYAYITLKNRGIAIINMKKRSAPFIEGYIDFEGEIHDVKVFNNTLFFTSGFDIYMYDVYSGKNPVLLGKINTEGYNNMLSVNGNEVVANDGFDFYFINTSNHNVNIHETFCDQVLDYFIDGNRFYAALKDEGLGIYEIDGDGNFNMTYVNSTIRPFKILYK